MIKGAQKKMIVVKTAESAVFEEAYFVLRRESLAQEADMVSEASRIIDAHGEKKRARKGIKIKEVAFCGFLFVTGVFCGGGAAAVLMLL